jgi:hypothetical protein
MTKEEARVKFGAKIQRCVGCFVAFYVRDMWLAQDMNYYCETCQTDVAGPKFHFEDYSHDFDFTQLPSMQEDA